MADRIEFRVFAPDGRLFDDAYARRVVGTEPDFNGTPSRVVSARVADEGQSLVLVLEAIVPEVVYESVERLSVARVPWVHPGLGRQGGLAFASRRFPGGR